MVSDRKKNHELYLHCREVALTGLPVYVKEMIEYFWCVVARASHHVGRYP